MHACFILRIMPNFFFISFWRILSSFKRKLLQEIICLPYKLFYLLIMDGNIVEKCDMMHP